MRKLVKVIAVVGIAAAIVKFWPEVPAKPLPPTIAAEEIAFKLYGNVCPRDVPRSAECRVLFGQVEREYLQSVKR